MIWLRVIVVRTWLWGIGANVVLSLFVPSTWPESRLRKANINDALVSHKKMRHKGFNQPNRPEEKIIRVTCRKSDCWGLC